MKKIIPLIILVSFFYHCPKAKKEDQTIAKFEIPKINPEDIKIDTAAIKDTFMPKGYSYEAPGRSDPLKPLVGVTVKEEQKEIDLSTLKLVGILRGVKGNAALFEGSDGRAYFIRQGDRVRGGYVKTISAREVIVEITIYGKPIEVRYSLKSE
jgi:Tfp pilus assembly protein PilP